jgi:hypothetical protein
MSIGVPGGRSSWLGLKRSRIIVTGGLYTASFGLVLERGFVIQ